MQPDNKKRPDFGGAGYQSFQTEYPINLKRNQACPSCGYKDAFTHHRTNGKDLFYCHVDCSQEEVLAAMRGDVLTHRPSRRDHSQAKDPTDTSNIARKIWQSAMTATDTLAELYLRHRGITLSPPSCLRFIAKHRHSPTGTDWPVMIAAVRNLQGDILAVHRTFLAADGKSKAPIDPPRMTLGPIAGGTIQLAPAAETLGVAEGIETGLSAIQVTGIPTWAVISAGGMKDFIPPPEAKKVIFFADHDDHGLGLTAAKTAASRMLVLGLAAEIQMPKAINTDFNDLHGGKNA